MSRDACLSDEILVAFNLGELPEDLLDSVREHQESCPRCELRARKLDDHTDLVIDDLRTALRRLDADGGGPGWEAPPEAREADARLDGPEGDEGRRPVLPDYEVEETPLGQGSMGVVYKARHLKLDRVVALKMVASRSPEAVALFQSEAKAVAQLQHPNIVQIFEIGQHEGRPFLSFEFVEGGSLAQRIAGRPQPPRASAEVVRTLALAVDYAHRQGIVHRDLKPFNILITPEGVPKVADFGVAKWLKSEDHLGRDGDILGTPRYMAPEQANGSLHEVGPAADIYSLGVILYEMLTGRPPHQSTSALETLTLVREEEPVPPRELQPKLSRDLETIVLKCLRKEPTRRYGDAKGLADDLERYLAGEPILARRVGVAERVYFWGKRHFPIVGVAILAGVWLTDFALNARGPQGKARHVEVERKPSSKPVPPVPRPPGPPETIVQLDGSIRLGAASATVHGESLRFETPYGNLGYWHDDQDYAVWTFRVDEPGTFVLSLDYACRDQEAGNRFRVRVDKEPFRGRVSGTRFWSNYQSFIIGEVTLGPGIHELEVRPETPLAGALFDLRAVTLAPREGSDPPRGPQPSSPAVGSDEATRR